MGSRAAFSLWQHQGAEFSVPGLGAQFALRAWWTDAVASLAIVYFPVKEGREAWEGDA